VRRRLIWIALLGVAGLIWSISPDNLLRNLAAYVTARSPHERYAATLRLREIDETAAGAAWLTAAGNALLTASTSQSPFAHEGALDPGSSALAWRFPVRQGQRITVDAAFAGPLFLDLFNGDELVASAAADATALVHDALADGDYLLRVQAPLGAGGKVHLAQQALASMQFPVRGLTPRAVQSVYGDPRDRGVRDHEGIDIFAPRGTPVLAATEGVVSGSTTNRLGGNVVWLSSTRGVRTYYAHLDRQAVAPGDRIAAGDVLGFVGTTGNARGGAPHLHFGIYASGGPVDPLPFVCDAPCGAAR
jgi:murein DD-endopeptidase MepM/ murein hydrolase activator NlpD